MIKEDFFQTLSSHEFSCIVLDDLIINPDEIIVFLLTKSDLKSLKNEHHFTIKIQDQNRERIINYFVMDEIGLHKCKNDLLKRGKKVRGNLYHFSTQDEIAIWLFYKYMYVIRPNYLTFSIGSVLIERLNLKSEGELLYVFAEYIEKEGFKIESKRAVKLPKVIAQKQSAFFRMKLLFHLFIRKSRNRIIVNMLKFMGYFHVIFTQKKYLEYIISNDVTGQNWEMINKKKDGSSGCTFVTSIENNKKYFIKGNELPVYCGLKNEIVIQNQIMSQGGNLDWLLKMEKADDNNKWIKYPYVNYKTLTQYTDSHDLDEDERRILGEFLVSLLDKLNKLNIVHNDLRSDNIMVIEDLDHKVSGYILIDFGCSVYKGQSPWDEDTFWGKYFAYSVCGSYRYNERIIDDAAAALLVYTDNGGKTSDEYFTKIKEKIGRIYSNN